MDLDGDGHTDILSGCYSRHERDMAGLFHLLRGTADGAFAKPVQVKGTDGELLILPMREDQIVDRICTRPFACDLDADGDLDLVVGNFTGTFAVYHGEGKGRFSPTATWLEKDGERLQVAAHSDPFLCDWDGDGDLDLLSGSAQGGVFLFVNEGSESEPKFGTRQTLLEPAGYGGAGEVFGDAHLKAPASGTRVWADDVDGDGKLDLLVGDQVMLLHAAKGVAEADAKKRYAAHQQKQTKVFQDLQDEPAKISDAYQKLEKEKAEFVHEERTGFVWLLRRR